jgi:beta-N-acetylhexosaminidase
VGLGPALSSLLPGTVRVALPAVAPYNVARTRSIVAQAAGRPLVIAIHDAHRARTGRLAARAAHPPS